MPAGIANALSLFLSAFPEFVVWRENLRTVIDTTRWTLFLGHNQLANDGRIHVNLPPTTRLIVSHPADLIGVHFAVQEWQIELNVYVTVLRRLDAGRTHSEQTVRFLLRRCIDHLPGRIAVSAAQIWPRHPNFRPNMKVPNRIAVHALDLVSVHVEKSIYGQTVIRVVR